MRQLDALIWSEDPTVASRVMQLSAGGDKVSAVKVRELVQELNTGLDHSLSPGNMRCDRCSFTNYSFLRGTLS